MGWVLTQSNFCNFFTEICALYNILIEKGFYTYIVFVVEYS